MVSKSAMASVVALAVVAVACLMAFGPWGDDESVSNPVLRTDVRVGDTVVVEGTTVLSDEFEHFRSEYTVLEASSEGVSVREVITDTDTGRQSDITRTFPSEEAFLEGVYVRAPMDSVARNFEVIGDTVLDTPFGRVACDIWRSTTSSQPFEVWLSSDGTVYMMAGDGFEIRLVSTSLLSG